MQVIQNKALLLRTRKGPMITQAIPKSEIVSEEEGIYEVLVHWGLEEAQVLKNLRIKNVPSPIIKDYEWSGILPPFAHQKTTAAFLTLYKRCFCFNEQGTGKTASAIWAVDYLMKLGVIKRVLVICPLSIMQAAWGGDLFRFAMHRSVGIAHGDRKKREKVIEGGHDFTIINFDGVETVFEAIKAAEYDLIIVDEASAYKSVSTTRWKTLNKLLRPHMWLWMMTGTPAAQSPMDAYGLAKLVSPDRVPKFQGQFKDRVLTKITQFKWVPKPDATTIVHQILQPAIRFSKEDCLDLPEITYTSRHVPLTKTQEEYYRRLRQHLVSEAAGETITIVNAAAKLLKLLQLSSGAVYSDAGEVVDFDASNRLVALKEVIAEASHKVLVFVNFRHAIDIIHADLHKSGITAEVINGAVPANKRTEIFHRFQTTDSPRVLIIQPQAAAHGVTLHAANVVVWWGPITSTETYLQANARTHRAGQKNPVTVVHLEGSAIERQVYGMLQNNIDIHQRVIELYQQIKGQQ